MKSKVKTPDGSPNRAAPPPSHLSTVAAHYDSAPDETPWAARDYRRLLAHYYRLLIPPTATILEVGCGNGELLAHLPNPGIWGVDVSPKQIDLAKRRLPHGEFRVQAGEHLALNRTFDAIVVSETLNFAEDVQQLLERLHSVSTPSTRLVLNFHNALWRPLLSLADALGLRTPPPTSNWLSRADLQNIALLADWEIVSMEPRMLCPLPLAGLHQFLNRWLAPLLGRFCLTVFAVGRSARRKRTPPGGEASVSIVIPARNEAGNITPEAMERIPRFGSSQEIIFVEGHSQDETWEAIERTIAAAPERFHIRALRQTGAGKGNAVREGFAVATGDILMILDADLTMPPEELPKYYTALISGKGELINGVRLVYPMDDDAMPFLNMCANTAFSFLFSFLLGQRIRDTLCGTKALYRSDYDKIDAGRAWFGEFDPFGDFDLLFGAGKQHLRILDLPIRYRDRAAGTTNIRRWSHGWLLLRMVLFGAAKIKFV